jgi:hypothetical protein
MVQARVVGASKIVGVRRDAMRFAGENIGYWIHGHKDSQTFYYDLSGEGGLTEPLSQADIAHLKTKRLDLCIAVVFDEKRQASKFLHDIMLLDQRCPKPQTGQVKGEVKLFTQSASYGPQIFEGDYLAEDCPFSEDMRGSTSISMGTAVATLEPTHPVARYRTVEHPSMFIGSPPREGPHQVRVRLQENEGRKGPEMPRQHARVLAAAPQLL